MTTTIIISGLTILGGILTVIEKSQKVKWRPISWLLGKEETDKKLDVIQNSIICLQNKVDKSTKEEREHYKKQAKILITDFATDLRNNIKKSETEYIAILELCKEYLDKGWNSKIKFDAEYIIKKYKEEMED